METYDTLANDCESIGECLGWIESLCRRSSLTMRPRLEILKQLAEKAIQLYDAPMSESPAVSA